MSLARTALRLAVVEALRADPVIVALCANRIYDSRAGDADSLEIGPFITVFTEDDEGTAFDPNNGGPPFDITCNLVFEIEVRSFVEEDGQVTGTAVTVTDPEAEADLDMLQDRAITAVTTADTAARRTVELVSRRVQKAASQRFSSKELNARIAFRLVTLSVEMKCEDQADVHDLTQLPEPLNSVCAAMPAGSYGEAMCTRLLARLPAPSAPQFRGANFDIQPVGEFSPDHPPSQVSPDGTPIIQDDTNIIPPSP